MPFSRASGFCSTRGWRAAFSRVRQNREPDTWARPLPRVTTVLSTPDVLLVPLDFNRRLDPSRVTASFKMFLGSHLYDQALFEPATRKADLESVPTSPTWLRRPRPDATPVPISVDRASRNRYSR